MPDKSIAGADHAYIGRPVNMSRPATSIAMLTVVVDVQVVVYFRALLASSIPIDIPEKYLLSTQPRRAETSVTVPL
jgi:hypothetical protein